MYGLYRRSVSMFNDRAEMKTLSSRYQQFENSTWAHSICVSFVMYFLLVAAGLSVWIWYFIVDPEQSEVRTLGLAVAEVGFIQADAFSLLHVLGIMFSNKFIRSAVIKDLQAIGILSNSVGPGVKRHENEAEEYFNQFEQAWK
uniref:DUF3341 domain-containing protein n=2 Tax=Bursaphelenchus xylophilus TaxID=6326 RepID=A0A1I7SKE0_BURXY